MNSAAQAAAAFAPPSQGWSGWMHRLVQSARGIPENSLDRSTGLFNRGGLFDAANTAVDAADAPTGMSMVVLEFTDLREVWEIYGPTVGRKVVDRIVRRLRALAGSRGFAGRTGATQFTVVLPGVAHQKALSQLQRVFGKPARVEFDAGDSEIVLVPDVFLDEGEPGTPAQTLYRDICRDLARVQKEELRRLNFLTNERERHSRPMSLPAR